MNRPHRPSQSKNPPSTGKGSPDFILLVLTLLLVGFGVVMVFSSSSSLAAVSSRYDYDSFYFAKRQLMWAGLGFVAMLFAMNIRYTAYKILFIPLFIVTVLMLIIVPFAAENVNGARSWLNIGGLGIQPTELAKIAVVLYLSALIAKKGEKFRDFRTGLFPVMIIVGFVVGLIMLQPDMGGAMILTACAGVIVIAGGANLKHIMNCLLVGIVGVLVVLGLSMLFMPDKLSGGYKMARVQSWLDPFHDSQAASYNLLHSLKAIAHGGWTGAGFGQSIQKLLYLPYPYNDFIFAIIAEELGFIGTVIFLLVYICFIWRGILIALRCPDIYGTLVSIGIVGIIAVQAFINIGGVTRTIPITGVTMPFISYGGSSLFITMVSVGILLSVSREYNRVQQKKETGQSVPRRSNKKDYRPLRSV
ncbi:putative lipid II flippase FtsW [Paenibacillus melissococcoides]|uniref:Probable peptidoglycan glycosyltransferase FtsW n=1 Tax=Paenibacillus melissococcoides TaxID=2912268 RepID=A0ABM9G7C8_9BACL|nr:MULTISPECIES: putative lipid II flippase FtsW [Paenibacillus]MEB9897726.1 putative lipid II flippase FtsW [Bacillus cereus]CAH8247276.1 putative lipid II flippase FtsW [Paenibacillus melissococcoides]CAH8717229.1 putative lipid II flippase FtsW [Paenibacillus melissococcoides]CAH8718217.1 putative lipid II flippase FtsW [Paenibacillus melissococcoides]GIO77923.1 stage V sporulation protein E [Paenibacillus dendritiformis]